MDETALLDALQLGESVDCEFKFAKGGLPLSLWETYSAMANTDGGSIILGVENDGTVSGLANVPQLRKAFWDTINNRSKVNRNLLADADLKILTLEGKTVLMIHVPRAERRQRPIYIGQNPLDGTFRRNDEGDYKCRPDEVGRMLADQAEESPDESILEHFTLDDLDQESLQQYRHRFSARAPTHPWLALDETIFLQRLGAFRQDRRTGRRGPTVAGLFMFGRSQALYDLSDGLRLHLDYRERLSPDPNIRWTDRVTDDGTWACNLFQFYQRVIPRLTVDLKLPFGLTPDLIRTGETEVHQSVREALTNALIHADYRGQGGIIIEKYRDRLEFSNPGLLLLDIEQIYRGGVSECRNPTLQKLFFMIGYGEKAGSGFDKIRHGWQARNWRLPLLEETQRPDRVRIILPMVSLLPDASLARLRQRFGPRLDRLDKLEIQALVTADLEGQVTNIRLRQMSAYHPSDVTKVLQGLVAGGFLEKSGQARATTYYLPGTRSTRAPYTDELFTSENSPHNSGNSPHNNGNSPHNSGAHPPIAPEQDPVLQALAEPARQKKRLNQTVMQQVVLQLCQGRYLTARAIASLLNRDARHFQDRFLTPMVQQKRLTMRYPNEPNHPDQAYTAAVAKETP